MKLEAVIFDWAGTVVDFGSLAPVQAFQALFAKHGVDITVSEAREPMGLEKREHIQQILGMPRVNQVWTDRQGATVDESLIDKLYQEFIPEQIKKIQLNTQLIDGTVETVALLRQHSVLIGTTTGYARHMIDGLLAAAAEQGFDPDATVAADEVGRNRPAATAALKNLVQLDVAAVHNCVKVDDTEPGIAEGSNAGMWTVGVVLSGNALGLSGAQWRRTESTKKVLLKNAAYEKMQSANAHYLIDSVADLPDVLHEISQRLCSGEKP